MPGIFLIIVGLMSMVYGVMICLKKESSKIGSRNNVKEKQTSGKITESIKNLIILAAADGVVTENEKQVIQNQVAGSGIDQKEVDEYLKNELTKTEWSAETKVIDKYKEAGNNFERFILSRFDRNYYKLKEWAGDKYHNGIYAETTTNPDLVFCIKISGTETKFAVECKYRKQFFNNGIEWAKECQIKNYQYFQKTNNTPVFVAIGVGGSPWQPDHLYLVPLNRLNYPFVSKEYLEKFKKSSFTWNSIHFDYKKLTLT